MARKGSLKMTYLHYTIFKKSSQPCEDLKEENSRQEVSRCKGPEVEMGLANHRKRKVPRE